MRAHVDAEKRLKGLSFRRDRLVYTCEHVAYIAQRVVCV